MRFSEADMAQEEVGMPQCARGIDGTGAAGQRAALISFVPKKKGRSENFAPAREAGYPETTVAAASFRT